MWWEWNGNGWLPEMKSMESKPRAYWEADELVDRCPTCSASFNLFVRRHHCRNCGGVFCSECTTCRVKLSGYENSERVCHHCFENVRSDVVVFNKSGFGDNVSRWKLLLGRITNGRAQEGEVISHIFEGVPDAVRGDLWRCFSPSKSGKYAALIQAEPLHQDKIQMDVTRVFPENSIIQCDNGQLALTHLLYALMAYYPNMGYSQNTAFVAGIALLALGYAREEDAFWVLIQLFEKPKGPLVHGRVDAAVEYVRAVLEASYPELADHLASQKITLDVFVHRWLTTLFSYDLPLAFTLRAWDLLLTCGHLFAPALALALLDHSRAQLMEFDADGIVKYFNHLPPSLFAAKGTLLDDALTHWRFIRKK